MERGAYLLHHHALLPIRLCNLVGRCREWYIEERVKRRALALRYLQFGDKIEYFMIFLRRGMFKIRGHASTSSKRFGIYLFPAEYKESVR